MAPSRRVKGRSSRSAQKMMQYRAVYIATEKESGGASGKSSLLNAQKKQSVGNSPVTRSRNSNHGSPVDSPNTRSKAKKNVHHEMSGVEEIPVHSSSGESMQAGRRRIYAKKTDFGLSQNSDYDAPLQKSSGFPVDPKPSKLGNLLASSPSPSDGSDDSRPSKKRKKYLEQSGDPENVASSPSAACIKPPDAHVEKRFWEQQSGNPEASDGGSALEIGSCGDNVVRTSSVGHIAPSASATNGHKNAGPLVASGGAHQSAAAGGKKVPESIRMELESGVFQNLFRNMHNALLDRLKDIKETQTAELGRMTGGLKCLREQVQQIGCGNSPNGFGTGSTSKESKTALGEWENKLEDLTPMRKLAFSTEIFSAVLAYNVPKEVVTISQNCSTEGPLSSMSPISVQGCSNALAMLLFSLKPSESRDKYSEGAGKLHSEFKFTVMMNLFFNIQMNSFGLFMEAGKSNVAVSNFEQDCKKNVLEKKLPQPVWLKSGYVTKTYICAARAVLEQKHQTRKDRVRDVPTRADIATYGAVKVSRMLISHLHDGREKVRVSFFQDIGYLLCDWSAFSTDIDQTNIGLKWQSDNAGSGSGRYYPLETVEEAKTCRKGDNTSDADAENKDTLNAMYDIFPEMVLIAKHEVCVVSGDNGKGKQRRHSGGHKEKLRRMINLIEVSLNFCVEYTQIGDSAAFLRAHKDSLRCVYAIAVVFKEMVEQFLRMVDFKMRKIPRPEEIIVGTSRLDQLFPGKGSRNSVMSSRSLRMTQKEYEDLNQPTLAMATFDHEIDVEDEDAELLQASKDLGVAVL